LDILIIILLGYAAFKGWCRGLIMALFSFAGMILGIFLAMKFSAAVALYLEKHSSIPDMWLPVAAFVIILLGVGLLVRLVGGILEKTAELSMLGPANKLGGALLYIVLYGLLISILLYYATNSGLCDPVQSGVAGFLQEAGAWVMENAGQWIPGLGNTLRDLDSFFERH